jgi:hypothetical protein
VVVFLGQHCGLANVADHIGRRFHDEHDGAERFYAASRQEYR